MISKSDLTMNWIKTITEPGRREQRRNLFFWNHHHRYDKMHRNELIQKKAARAARKHKLDNTESKED